jgi:glycosyltransferase involved in cell wall biosynthesis
MINQCLSVVIPAYNEENTLKSVVDKVLTLPFLQQIVIVDDCSSDKTPQIADRLALQHSQVVVIHQQRNQGKTEALKAGFQRTTGSIVIVQDADLEYDPDEIPVKPGHEHQPDRRRNRL